MTEYTEEQAIRSLQRLAKKWPQSLTLLSMGGTLSVVHTDDDRWNGYGNGTLERQEAVIADIYGIPNDGGDW